MAGIDASDPLPEIAGLASLEREFNELRPTMLALAYRITGSRSDSEDIVQDAFLRMQTAAPSEEIRSVKAYLTTITARLSLNRLRDLRTQREAYVGQWLPEPLPTDGDPVVLAEELSFALLVVLERLSPLERVVFLLRSSFEWDFEEIGSVIGRTGVACRQLFSRARAHISRERPRFPVDRQAHRALLHGFHQAARGNEISTLLKLLAEGAVLHGDGGGKALGLKKPVVGRQAVARFVVALGLRMPPDTRVEEVELNGTPAVAFLAGGRPFVVIMIEADDGRIRRVFAIANPDKLTSVAAAVRLASGGSEADDQRTLPVVPMRIHARESELPGI
jgi:RNA polymerase sigma-70 factor, ECF subfamily